MGRVGSRGASGLGHLALAALLHAVAELFDLEGHLEEVVLLVDETGRLFQDFLRADSATCASEEAVRAVRAAGVVGLGGAGAVRTDGEVRGERGLVERERPHAHVVDAQHARQRQERVRHLLQTQGTTVTISFHTKNYR